MPFWQRFLILILAVIVISMVIGMIWHSWFGFALPAYASGVISGLAAVWLWDMLKRIKAKQ